MQYTTTWKQAVQYNSDTSMNPSKFRPEQSTQPNQPLPSPVSRTARSGIGRYPLVSQQAGMWESPGEAGTCPGAYSTILVPPALYCPVASVAYHDFGILYSLVLCATTKAQVGMQLSEKGNTPQHPQTLSNPHQHRWQLDINPLEKYGSGVVNKLVMALSKSLSRNLDCISGGGL